LAQGTYLVVFVVIILAPSGLGAFAWAGYATKLCVLLVLRELEVERVVPLLFLGLLDARH
jgi:hypothetical protein